MPTRDTAPVGAPCWIDLSTSDTAKAAAFYTQLLGWQAEDPNPDFGGYFNFSLNGVLVAGCMSAEPGNPVHDLWSVYLATDDAAKTVDTAADRGGQVIVPAMPVGDLGTMAVITDAGGAGIGMWQPGLHRGFGVFGEPGSPAWFELYTRDYDAAVAFYRDVFRWDTAVISDTPEFRYTVLHHGDQELAGIMDSANFLPEGVPSFWTVYIAVDDTDAAVAKAVDLGGEIREPAMDTPYGRLATVADPMGAAFKLMAR